MTGKNPEGVPPGGITWKSIETEFGGEGEGGSDDDSPSSQEIRDLAVKIGAKIIEVSGTEGEHLEFDIDQAIQFVDSFTLEELLHRGLKVIKEGEIYEYGSDRYRVELIKEDVKDSEIPIYSEPRYRIVGKILNM